MENARQPIETSMHTRALRLEWATLFWNVVEAVVAIGSGAVAGSAALVAFGVDSLIEVSSALAVLWRLLRAGPETPLDEQLELDRRAHLMVGFTFFALAVYIIWDAGGALIRRSEPESSIVGMVLAVASLIAMPVLGTLKSRAGKAMGSGALQADAVETWLCAYLSATLLLGLVLNTWKGWWWADPAAALVMVPFIVWQGWDALAEARQD